MKVISRFLASIFQVTLLFDNKLWFWVCLCSGKSYKWWEIILSYSISVCIAECISIKDIRFSFHFVAGFLISFEAWYIQILYSAVVWKSKDYSKVKPSFCKRPDWLLFDFELIEKKWKQMFSFSTQRGHNSNYSKILFTFCKNIPFRVIDMVYYYMPERRPI